MVKTLEETKITSALERYCRRSFHQAFEFSAFTAALQHDWDHGREERLSEIDRDGKNGVIRSEDGYVGFVGTYDHQTKAPFVGFRSIPRNSGTAWRDVFGKAKDGRIVHVGDMHRPVRRARSLRGGTL